MVLSKLTEKEKIVFANIVKHPDLSDRELSEKIKVKRSTITSIRNRLKAEGYYETVVIPNLPRLGCKLIGFMYTKFSPIAPRQVRRQSAAFDATVKHPELVFARSTDTEFVGIYCGKDLYNIKKVQDFLIYDYGAKDFIEEVNRVFYPVQMAEIHSFLNYTPLMKKLFEMEIDEFKLGWNKFEEANLNKTEKIIMHAIVKYPDKSSIEISKITGKTRSTVSKVKKDLIENNMIRVANIPIMSKLGCELMIYTHIKFNSKCPMDVRKEGINLSLREALPVFDVTSDLESSAIWIFKNYTEYMEIYNKIFGFFKENEYLAEKPFELVFPIQNLRWRKLDFSQITEKLLFGKDDY